MSINKIYLLQQQPYRYKNTNDCDAKEYFLERDLVVKEFV